MAVKVSLHHDGVDEGNLEVLPKFKKKMNSNDSFERKGVAVKDLKEHDAVNNGSLGVPSRSKKKTIFNGRFE